MATAMFLQCTLPAQQTPIELECERHYASRIKTATLRDSGYLPRDMTAALSTESKPPQVVKRKRDPIICNFTLRDEVAILCEEGRLKDAVDMLFTMDGQGIQLL